MRRAMVTIGEVAGLLRVTGYAPSPGGAPFARVSAILLASPDAIVFAVDEKAMEEALASPAGLILARSNPRADARVLVVKEPREAFSRVYQEFFVADREPGAHASAILEAGVTLGEGTSVGAGSVLEEGVTTGRACWIGPRVVVHRGTTLGDRVRVQAGTVLGSDGFGYTRVGDGYVGFPQIGTLWIGDDVEIGANVTVDRGALGETRIGRGTKIDNLVHIAHNCSIGENVLIAAQVGMAGSCTIEDGAMLGGQVGLGEGVTIGRGVILGGQGGVLPGKRIDGVGVVYWGTPAQPVREYLRGLARLRKGS